MLCITHALARLNKKVERALAGKTLELNPVNHSNHVNHGSDNISAIRKDQQANTHHNDRVAGDYHTHHMANNF